LLQDRRNIFDARENFPAARGVIRSRHGERFDHRGKRLRDIEIGITFPAWINVEFPAHPRQGGADQTIVNLLRDRPSGWIQFFPATFELGEILSLFVYASVRPVARPARPFDTVDIIAGKWRVLRTPRPEILRQFIQRVGCR
jgi:hypothetical protein